jgi:probable rRNA maturation factor
MLELIVQNLHPQAPLTEEEWVRYFSTWIIQPDLGLPAASGYEITLRLTDDPEVRQLNSQYRQQDKTTDVLAFATSDETLPQAQPADAPLYLGDIIVSVDTAQRQALTQNHGLATEMLWLASHGFLHLLGWDHPDDLALMEMLACQDRLLGTIGVTTATD